MVKLSASRTDRFYPQETVRLVAQRLNRYATLGPRTTRGQVYQMLAIKISPTHYKDLWGKNIADVDDLITSFVVVNLYLKIFKFFPL
jgi:hypothetical protein